MTNTYLINMVEIVKQTRKLLGITQHELAEKSGVSYSTISKFEAGLNTITSDTQNKIIKAIIDEGFNINALIQLSLLLKNKGEK